MKEIEQYHYRDEEEKVEHAKQMKSIGFEDSGQLKKKMGIYLTIDTCGLVVILDIKDYNKITILSGER